MNLWQVTLLNYKMTSMPSTSGLLITTCNYRISSNRRRPRIVAAQSEALERNKRGTRTRVRMISDDGHHASARTVFVVRVVPTVDSRSERLRILLTASSNRRWTLWTQTLPWPVHHVQNCARTISGIFNTYSGWTQSTNRPFLFHRPFARTNYFYNSFVPRTVSIWNTLPVSLVSNSYVPHFRSHACMDADYTQDLKKALKM